jgi:hypothetical protein
MINEFLRMQLLAGLITESELRNLSENKRPQYTLTSDEGDFDLYDEIDNLLKNVKFGYNDLPSEYEQYVIPHITKKINRPLKGNEKQRITTRISKIVYDWKHKEYSKSFDATQKLEKEEKLQRYLKGLLPFYPQKPKYYDIDKNNNKYYHYVENDSPIRTHIDYYTGYPVQNADDIRKRKAVPSRVVLRKEWYDKPVPKNILDLYWDDQTIKSSEEYSSSN